MTTETDLDPQIHPADILMNLIIVLLAPMFLTAANGDIIFARMAALETINAYRSQTHAELIVVAQIVACGLAALGSLSLSMADDIPLSMTLRLRGNANALMRSAEQARRALKEFCHNSPRPPEQDDAHEHDAPLSPDDEREEAEVIASVAAAQKLAAEFEPSRPAELPRPAEPSPIPAPTAPAASITPKERQRQAMWGAGAARLAAEYTASLPHLPPAERKMATFRAAILSHCATDLLTGNGPQRLRPGDLAAITLPSSV
jgi:hypothetical protein